MSSDEAPLARVEALQARLQQTRVRLDSAGDPENAIEVLQELAEIAKEIEVEIGRARREAEGRA